MSLSRKHYEAVAEIIESQTPYVLDEYSHGLVDGCRNVAEALASYFASDNPAFDRDRFLTACGVQS